MITVHIKDRVEQRVALGDTAEEIAHREKLPVRVVLEVMAGMDEAHHSPEVISLADADKIAYPQPETTVIRLPVDENPPEPLSIRSQGCAICFRRKTHKPNAVCWACNEAADRWETSLTPDELAELEAAMNRHPAGKAVNNGSPIGA